MTDTLLLTEFPGIETEEWERIIREDLKGADYSRSLVWCPEEGLAIRPFYRAEDLDRIEHLHGKTGERYPAHFSKAQGWRIRERIDSEDAAKANSEACRALSEGAEEIAFSSASIANASDLAMALANLDEIPIDFESADRQLVRLLMEWQHRRNRVALISADFDPLGDLDFAAEVLARRPPGLVPFSISALDFHEQGATSAEEVGLALAAGVDFVASMEERGLRIDQTAGSLTFTFGIGPEFLLQIAKLRAFRIVWEKAVESFSGESGAAAACIHARTANWNQTIYDAHVNILRATTEAMSAALGGADSIEIAAFNGCYTKDDEVSRRLARNTHLILKHEAQLARVADPGNGSYGLEVLTDTIAQQAWQLLQKIESEGGYRAARQKGTVSSLLSRRGDQRARSIATRKRVLTGTNRFANPSESALNRMGNTDSISSGRAAEAVEALRLRTERETAEMSEKPRILLAEVGEDRKCQSARSNFAADFLACAGLESTIVRFQRAEEIAGGHWDLIVLCSANAEYLSIASALVMRLKASCDATPVVVAGLPDTVDQLRALGVSEFIHARCNAVETLANIQRLVGIKD